MRNNKIDLLRFIGLMMIILAHLKPEMIVFQLRNFDVPLMVLISGISFKLSYNNKEPYFKYVWKRIKRLVFPVWFFLTFYFFFIYLLNPYSDSLNPNYIAGSFLLISGIGYVWIIRVFLMVALVAPFLYLINKKIISNAYFFFILLISIILFEIITYFTLDYFNGSAIYIFLGSIIFYIVPYSTLYIFGIRIDDLSKKILLRLFCFLLILFISISSFLFYKDGRFIGTQEFKSPPSIYYFSYALMVSIVFWIYSDFIWGKLNNKMQTFILFVSKNSIWIYLWHIPFVVFYNEIETNLIVKYFLLILTSTSITYFQVYFVEKILFNYIHSKVVQKYLKIIFL